MSIPATTQSIAPQASHPAPATIQCPEQIQEQISIRNPGSMFHEAVVKSTDAGQKQGQEKSATLPKMKRVAGPANYRLTEDKSKAFDFGDERLREIFSKEVGAFIEETQRKEKNQQPKKPYKRKYPPVNVFTDACVQNALGVWRPKSGYSEIFADGDILECHAVVHKQLLEQAEESQTYFKLSAACVYDEIEEAVFRKDVKGEPVEAAEKASKGAKDAVYIEYTKHGKAIIQQQASKGCTAAVAAMLIVDHKKKYSLKSLQMREVSPFAKIVADLQKAGLRAIEENVRTMGGLRQALKENGSAIVSIGNGSTTGHVIIVDEITAATARVRDPYHGWEITVKRQALEKQIEYYDVIQVIQKK